MSEQEQKVEQENVKKHGFFLGFFHGIIAPYKLFGKIFGYDVEFFKKENISPKYTLGAVIGLIGSISKVIVNKNSNKSKKKKVETNKK